MYEVNIQDIASLSKVHIGCDYRVDMRCISSMRVEAIMIEGLILKSPVSYFIELNSSWHIPLETTSLSKRLKCSMRCHRRLLAAVTTTISLGNVSKHECNHANRYPFGFIADRLADTSVLPSELWPPMTGVSVGVFGVVHFCFFRYVSNKKSWIPVAPFV